MTQAYYETTDIPREMQMGAGSPRRVIRFYSLFQVFFNLLLWVPVFYEFQKRIGLSDPQIFRIQSIYYLVFCFLEVPTGFFADRYGYRNSLIVGSLVLVAANLLPTWMPDYSGMLIHFLAIALARSLISGASSAWLYEYLKQHQRSQDYKRIEGDARFYSLIARVAAWAVVGYLMSYNLQLPYWISALNGFIALTLAWRLPQIKADGFTATPSPNDHAPTKPTNSLLLALRTLWSSPLIVLYMLQGVGIFVMIRVLQVNLYQPILKQKAFDLSTFGWIMSLMTIFEALGSRSTSIIRGRLNDAAAVFLANLALGACLLAIALGGQALTLVGFCIFSLAAGLVFPVQKQLLNDTIVDGRARAILLSTESILDRAVCALAVLPLGGLVENGQLSQVLVICAIAAALGTAVVHAFVERFNRKKGATMPLHKVAASLLVGVLSCSLYSSEKSYAVTNTTVGAAADDWIFFDLGDVIVTGDPTAGYDLVPGIMPYLQSLRLQGYHLGLITNIPENWGETCNGKVSFLKEFLNGHLHGSTQLDFSLFESIIVPPYDRYRKPASYMFLRGLEAACGRRALFISESAPERQQAKTQGFAVFASDPVTRPFPALDSIGTILSEGYTFNEPEACIFDDLISGSLLPQDRSTGGVIGCVEH